MSFATGLFSFMGGASRQFREEIDVGVARKASAAAGLIAVPYVDSALKKPTRSEP